MRKTRAVAAVGFSALLALSACTTEESTDEASDGGTSASGVTTTTCAAGDRIGVALPAQTSENWTLAKDLFVAGLEEAGYVADVQFADASSAASSQQQKIDNMLTQGAKIMVIGAEDGKQLTTQVANAESQGVPVVAYDRPIDAPGTDYYIAFDNFKVGQLQGTSLLEGLEKLKGASPWSVELFAGAPTDANAPVFFNGAMDILKPKIDDGTLVVASGQTEFAEVATEGWKKEKAQERTDNLITNYYSAGTELAGALSPNDQLAQGILNAATAANQTPVVTGQDSEVAAVERIARGEQYSTIYKDTRKLVAATVDMVDEICAGGEATTNGEFNWAENDGSDLVLKAFYLEPVIVTQENAEEAYADNEELLTAFQNAA